MQHTSFQVLLFYVLVAVTGGLCLNTVVLYNVPVLSLGMKEKVCDASKSLRGREQVQTRRVPWQALKGCTEAFTLGVVTAGNEQYWALRPTATHWRLRVVCGQPLQVLAHSTIHTGFAHLAPVTATCCCWRCGADAACSFSIVWCLWLCTFLEQHKVETPFLCTFIGDLFQ